MKKILFYTRNEAFSHVIVKNFLAGFRRSSHVDVVDFKELYKYRKKIKKTEYGIVYHDDPIAMFICFIFGTKAFKIFHSLEMYEYQVELNSLKRFIRFMVFKYLYKFSLRKCDLILFPNELRRDFYLNKYPWLQKRKTKIIENIPMNLQGVDIQKLPEATLAKEFSSKFKKTLVITGAIGEGRDITNVIKAFENQDIYGLCIITQSNIELNDSDSLLVFRSLPHEKVLSLYSFFDAGLLFYDNSPINVKFCAPTKMYEYLAKGLYLIGNENFSLQNNGYVDFFYSQPSDIFTALDKISELPAKEQLEFNFNKTFDAFLSDLNNYL